MNTLNKGDKYKDDDDDDDITQLMNYSTACYLFLQDMILSQRF